MKFGGLSVGLDVVTKNMRLLAPAGNQTCSSPSYSTVTNTTAEHSEALCYEPEGRGFESRGFFQFT
jgi:hypothetical protein